MLAINRLTQSSVEEWAKRLDQSERRELTTSEMQFMLTCLGAERAMEDDPEINKMLSGWNGTSLLYRRVNGAHTYTITKAVAAFMGANFIDRPGISTMYANYFQYKCHELHIRRIDMQTLGMRIIPDGPFTEASLNEAWEEQKVATRNGLINLLDMGGDPIKSIIELENK